jgi:hypothetical protein
VKRRLRKRNLKKQKTREIFDLNMNRKEYLDLQMATKNSIALQSVASQQH